MKLKVLAGVLFLYVFSVLPAQAATLYMDPGQATIERGDTVRVAVRLDTSEEECVNVVDGVISYSEQLKLVDVSRGTSIFSMWVEEPKIDDENNLLTFAGGIPNGYCGRIAGDPRLTNTVVELIFQSPGFVIGAEDVDVATVSFDPQTQVLLNDGFGTPADARFYGAQFTLEKNAGGTYVDEWSEVINNDTQPPNEFSITLERTPNAFHNRYFITFNTTDKQSGIDRYEVIEESISESKLFNWGREDAPWLTTNSPYELSDQTLNSIVRVRAIDKAGNEYVAVLIPEDDQRTMTMEVKVFIAVVGTVVFAFLVSGVLYFWLRRKRGENEVYETDEEPYEDDEEEIEEEIDGEEGVDWEYVEYEEEVEEEEPAPLKKSKKK